MILRVSTAVSDEAPCLVNAVDMPSMCNFIVPSVLQRGLLTIAISTSGVSPALSRSIRKEIEDIYGPEFSEYLKALQHIRAEEQQFDQKQRGLKSVASAGIPRYWKKERKTEKGKGFVERIKECFLPGIDFIYRNLKKHC
jgi:precorrin-2 dehydrogenase/sirohydrochlorin ferrochelatase